MSSSPARLDPADRASSTQASQRDEDAQYYRTRLQPERLAAADCERRTTRA